jgi:N-methylhydantoinase A
LSEDYFAGGKMRLDRASAEQAILDQVAGPLGLDLLEAAHGMYHIMNVNMASAIREISVQRGYDPRDFLLVCAGGAGPIHAALIATELEIPKILVPKESSIFCAAGMLLSDLKHDFVRSYHTIFSSESTDQDRFLGMVRELDQEGRAVLSSEGIPPERMRLRFSLDLRYVGQYHEVNVEADEGDVQSMNCEGMRKGFHREHNRLYGYDLEQEGTEVELVNVRMSAVGITEKPSFREEPFQGEDPSSCLKGERPVFLPEEKAYRGVPVYDGNRMGHGHRVTGPAIIEQVNTTIFVPNGWDMACDPFGSYVLSARS